MATPLSAAPRRVKAAFLGPFGVAIVAILTAFATAIYLLESNVRERDLAERLSAVAKLFSVKLDKDANLMRAVGRAMMENAAIAEAFRRADRDELERAGRSLFEVLRTDHRVTHLYFTRPDRINLYRFHSPEAHGDLIDRASMLQAHARRTAVQGLEMGPLGTLTLRVVMPWREGERDLGFVEIGEEIEHVIEEIRDALGVDVVALVNKRYVALSQWQAGQDLMRRQGDWNRFPSHVALAKTVAELPRELDENVLARLLVDGTVRIRSGDRSMQMAALPLADAGGRRIGELAILRDVSGLESTFDRYVLAVVLACLVVAATVYGAFYVALDRVERDYRRQHELEHRLLRLDTEHQRMLQVEKLSALGTMVGGIAHQLNNPLVGVVNMAELAQRDADDPSRTREHLTEIRKAGEDCRTFVRRMLEFSKVSCFDSKPTPIASLIEETVLMFRQTERRHLPVDVHVTDRPPMLVIDPILVRHALFNLLLNAAQATDGTAAIDIRLEPRADAVSGIPGWSLSVADRGRGIAPEIRDKIFVPFFTTRADGTGLGLPVVLHVALLHDGHVDVVAREGGGTIFSLWLPQ